MSTDNIIYDASAEATFEARSHVDAIRQDGKITKYQFKILVHNAPTLEGTLTREEVDLMFRLFTSEGANLTQKTVSRYFPLYTFSEFKKIKNAFNLTKSSVPFAPHIVEEHTEEELIELLRQQKENNFLKKYEQTKEQIFAQQYHDLLKTHHDLRSNVSSFKEFLGDFEFQAQLQFNQGIETGKTLIVYLSDMHVGADVSHYSIYSNPYNEVVINDRFQKILDFIYKTTTNFKVSNLVVCNLGDSLDGYNGQTTRGGHSLPQNLNNKDQYKTYISAMLDFFQNLYTSGQFSTIRYYCVEGGNHDGDFGYLANQALVASIQYLFPEINATIFDKFIDYLYVGSQTFILCHGKDAKDMFKNMPLTLNDKVTNQINEFIDYEGLHGPIHFIKGDLHQTATTYASRFRYKSVGSFFGSSEWIHKNFGLTKAVCDMDILLDDGTIFETQLVLQ
jgi:hypothetical protein